jgi:hypothetical protein
MLGGIKIHGGDFRKGVGSYGFGSITLPGKHFGAMPVMIDASELQEVALASEQIVKSWTGTAGWGATGAVLLGPVGLLAGLIAGGKRKEVTFVARFKDGRKFLATTDSATYTKLLAKAFK